jgi:hypothetical protein
VTPVFPKITWPLDQKQVEALALWLSQLKDLLTGRISYRDNMNSVVLEFEFVAGSAPSKKLELGSGPIGVIELDIKPVGSNVPPTKSDDFSWSYSSGSLTFPSYGTIAGTARYRARVLVVKG